MLRIFLSLVILISSFAGFAQNNAQWRGENRDGKYPDSNLLKSWPAEGPKMLWHFDQLGDGHASAAVTEKYVYTGGTEGDEGFVIAFDHSGKQVWKQIYGKEWMDSYDGVRTTPMINDGMLYVLSGLGELVAMNADDGTIIWKKNVIDEYEGSNIRWGLTENLLVEGENLFCTPGGSQSSVVALNKKSGELIWKSAAKGEKSAYCSPALINLDSRSLLVTHTQNSIVGIDTKDGKMLWSVDHPNKYSIHPNTPVYKDGMLYCFSGYGKGGVMLQLSDDGSSVNELWRNEKLDNQMGGVILLDGKIYGSGHANREWFCLDWKTGETLYSAKMLSRGNVIYADGMLYCYGDSGEVALVDVSNGSFNKVSSFRVPYGEKQHWAHLVIHNKKLYVRHGSSLMVYSIAK
ncbi:PQQ-binding-like beta-propeller repeat protein [Marinifilum fragile]|uniref:outer membrane protein assembly factor BamB family protein n=1 Tax=Marinifilum fragile TaxID=570161 RepID=UPI002AA5EE3A|nr:PQQ-binding-like beta-propeller repeat protein [Marinifilum fragile]